jgi:hypothetical protein
MLSDPGLTLTLYAAEPGSPTAHALDLLASWTSPPSHRPRPQHRDARRAELGRTDGTSQHRVFLAPGLGS